MADKEERRKSAAELLAEWRAAGRDTVAAHAASKVAGLALTAAAAAEQAAGEVEAAAAAALEAVERARAAAARARDAAIQAAEAATLALVTAEGDKVQANHEAEVAEHNEAEARDLFHRAQDESPHRTNR